MRDAAMHRDDFISAGHLRQRNAGLRNWDSEERCAYGTARDRNDWALLGESAAVRQLRSQIQRIAPYFRTALISGDAGSGKQAVAQAIHALSPGSGSAFVVTDAAAFADRVDCGEGFSRPGLLAAAGMEPLRCGTVYLKRVGELSPCQQAALLRFVQSCDELRRTSLTTQILAASDRVLRTLAAIGQFRQDLYARLSAVELQVPPLRQRVDDIPMLAELLLRRLADESGQPAKVLAELTLVQLRERQWPENLPELERVVAQAAAIAENGTIEPRHLPAPVQGVSRSPVAEPPVRLERLHDVVQRHVLEVLTRCGGNKLRAAELLGISRSTLYRMLGAKPDGMRSLME
jgi:DNA-binding NtrC family response regulator